MKYRASTEYFVPCTVLPNLSALFSMTAIYCVSVTSYIYNCRLLPNRHMVMLSANASFSYISFRWRHTLRRTNNKYILQ